MAEEKTIQEAPKPGEGKERPQDLDVLVRILGYDIPGNKNIYSGLVRVKGISWAISSAVCNSLGLKKSKKVSEFSKQELERIESFLKELPIPEFLKNRRFDPETGETSHIFGNDLSMKNEFDIKRLRKMKSYKGIRHGSKLPVRGQRTRANFRSRKNKQAVGIKRKNK